MSGRVAVAKHLVSALAHGGIAPPETGIAATACSGCGGGDARPLDAG
jgi:hypothetical protein